MDDAATTDLSKKEGSTGTNTPNPTRSDEKEDEKANIEKAMRFWKHPSLRDVPTDEKRAYLNERGVTDAQIHKAWERIVVEDGEQGGSTVVQPALTATATAAGSLQPTASSSAPQQPSLPPTYYQAAPGPQRQPQPYPNPTPVSTPYSNPTSYNPAHDQHEQGHPLYSYPDEEEPVNLAQGVTLVAMGGMLGLTVAAAARWLNGGEFQILPSPRLQGTQEEARRLVLQAAPRSQSDTEEEFIEEEEYEDDEEEEIMDLQVQSKLVEQIESLSETIKSHVGVQEKLLQKLSNQKSITDHSMNLLRSSDDAGKDNNSSKKDTAESLQMWSQLVELKAELRSFQQTAGHSNGDRRPWEEKMAEVMSRLESCLTKLEDSMDLNQQDKATTAASTNSTTMAPVKPQSVALQQAAPNPATSGAEGSSETSDPPSSCTLRQCVRRLATENDAISLRVGAQLMYLYIVNLSGQTDNPRYRKIFTSNESWQKVERLLGGKDLLLAVGFEETKSSLEWLPNGSTEEEMVALDQLNEAAAALSILKSGKPSNDLTELALAALSPDPDVEAPPPAPKPTASSSMVSPEQPNKMLAPPFRNTI